MFLTLINIEIIGFMIALVVAYFLEKISIKTGYTTERKSKEDMPYIIILCIFWWLTFPALVYLTFKNRYNDINGQ
jgi:hypothetical protein